MCADGRKTSIAQLAGAMLDSIAARVGKPIDTATRSEILGGFASLQPHADVQPALKHLRA